MTDHETAGSPAVAVAANRRAVIAWSLWDWGSAAFNAVIVTFVFSVYLTDAVGDNLPGPISASSLAGLVDRRGKPRDRRPGTVMGQRSDGSGHRKRSLGLLTLSVVCVTALMFLVEESHDYLWLGLLLIAIGTVLFEPAQVPYFATLRQVSTPDNVGRVSGLGWAFGYLGGIVLLLIVYVGLISGDGGLLGVSTENGLNIRWVAVVAAVWFLAFSIPVLLAVPELPADASPLPSAGFAESYRLLFAELAARCGVKTGQLFSS
ncbi:MFS transporter [Aeromicrobium sp. UC242_57]|uniref:MFS transporter n=1 Tax=Aeromicrobium sp. UC242_57 TaxID=3374624 RepID=UPI00379EBE08